MQDLLGTTLILLVACSLAAVVTAMLKLPALLGYLAVGAARGPSLAAWIVPGPALSFLSELGGLLLFMVGLEQVMWLGGIPVAVASGALASMRQTTTV